MLGADYYETDSEVVSLLSEGRVPIGIGENTKIKYRLLKTSFSFSVVTNLRSSNSFFLMVLKS